MLQCASWEQGHFSSQVIINLLGCIDKADPRRPSELRDYLDCCFAVLTIPDHLIHLRIRFAAIVSGLLPSAAVLPSWLPSCLLSPACACRARRLLTSALALAAIRAPACLPVCTRDARRTQGPQNLLGSDTRFGLLTIMQRNHHQFPKKAYLILKFLMRLADAVPTVGPFLQEYSDRWTWAPRWLDKELNGISYS